jgi:hypothetical protein
MVVSKAEREKNRRKGRVIELYYQGSNPGFSIFCYKS